MDSAKLESSEDNRRQDKLVSFLASLEHHIYRQIPPPDAVIRLSVPVDVAIRRNKTREKGKKEPDTYVLRRHSMSVVPLFPTARTINLNSNTPEIKPYV